MLNILICDDEKPFLDRLADKITVYLENREMPFQTAASCSGGEPPKYDGNGLLDIAFLDISMNAVSRMNATEYLRDKNRKIRIVFATGYMDHALGGYEVGAFRYPVKDSLKISFKECMEAVLKKFHVDTDEIYLESIDGKLYLKVDEIYLVESRGHRLLFLVVDGKHVTGTMSRKLASVEGLLDEHGFLRVHQSYMVSMKYIVNIVSYRLELEPDTTLHVSRNRYPYVKREYAIYKEDSL